MTTAKNDTLHLTVNGKQIKQVNEFVYPSYKLSATSNGTVAVKHRIGLGWVALEKNKLLLSSTRCSYHIKTKIFNTYILPVVFYGMECVIWTKKLQQTMKTFQNHIMRFMTNHRFIDHIKIEDLLKTTNLTPIRSTIKSKVLKLFGHIKRSKVGLSKICLEGTVEGKRNKQRKTKETVAR